MTGQPIRAEGAVDACGVEALGARMAEIWPRRGPVIGISVLIWVVLGARGVAFGGGRGRRVALRLVGLAVVYCRWCCCSAPRSSRASSPRLLVMLGRPLLAALTLAALRGYGARRRLRRSVLAYAVDVIAGSHLTELSLLGPNPASASASTGSATSSRRCSRSWSSSGPAPRWPAARRGSRRARCAAAFLPAGSRCAFVFAAGRFGADVGAAIVIPVGAAVAPPAIAAGGGARVLLVIAAPARGRWPCWPDRPRSPAATPI